MSSHQPTSTVLILGSGIHGAAIARELLLNGVDVVLADSSDIASGATSKSSRLIHGGLRYLEYGDIGLVRESLAERRLNLEVAPNFVEPLRLYIPVSQAWSGLISSAVGFLGGQRSAVGRWIAGEKRSRGYWPVRMGLSMYDWLARDEGLPASCSVPLNNPAAPRIDAGRYHSMIAYSDAQMRYPERVVVALLADAAAIAQAAQRRFTIATYCRLGRDEDQNGWRLESPLLDEALTVQPHVIVNASGAAGDATLRELGIERPPLFGGTKGSHIITWHFGLREALRGQAVYAEAQDGRPVFTLPFGEAVLIGTTDEAYTGPPEAAVASEEEIGYLLAMVQRVFGLQLNRSDVAAHYSGVRPLPHSDANSNAAISRDHSLGWGQTREIPVLTLVGGKLTTWRVFAEQAADHVLGKLDRARHAHTRTRRVPGNDPLPEPAHTDKPDFQAWAEEGKTCVAEVAALWPLLGTRLQEVLQSVQHEEQREVTDSAITDRVIRWMIRHEHVVRLEDLVERRLLTVFQRRLSRRHLEDLAGCLVETGRLSEHDVDAAVHQSASRLERYFGRRME